MEHLLCERRRRFDGRLYAVPQSLGPNRVYGIYVDTGLMREGETEFVGRAFEELGAKNFLIDHAEKEFLTALEGVEDPEQKRMCNRRAVRESAAAHSRHSAFP